MKSIVCVKNVYIYTLYIQQVIKLVQDAYIQYYNDKFKNSKCLKDFGSVTFNIESVKVTKIKEEMSIYYTL
jgi:hypothetical protein